MNTSDKENNASSLMLVGNGFDLMHDMKTSWRDFQEWWLWRIGSPQSNLVKFLQLAAPFDIDIFTLGAFFLDQVHSDIKTENLYLNNSEDEIEEAIFVDLCAAAAESNNLSVNGYDSLLWSDFESLLKCLNLPSVGSSDDGDWKRAAMEEGSSEIIRNSLGLSGKLSEWLSTKAMPPYPFTGVSHVIANVDLLVSFNYTDTIEHLYGREVLHIHGRLNSKKDELIVGSGPHSNNSYGLSSSLSYDVNNDEYHDYIEKFTQEKKLEDRLSSVRLKEITTLGFSFGDADHIYVKTLVGHTTENSLWTVYFHSESDITTAQQALHKAGYTGRLVFESSKALAS
ncbi:bacteriophage abortive infection AbiH family protein [Corynebacterium sp. CCM 9185]|uniref:Bacteriophage abortive infection AbiH n=1 Tax=Corynebacterium marambiense TaxID=2765364 RepID=A0ABS0VVU7_9CORY|nr:AbiH family protein [Corynebacterium marambiense]MBI9000916.1 hypothetical protein [Corynebacterium marambiense]MCK7662816.1 bacteriophage abortive infection AbiH family protein [Corynebacterium marambiense]MCX7542425.1 AbiH family protein [Corynebacterium marambiense]